MNKRLVVSVVFVVLVIVVAISFSSYQANLLEMHDKTKYLEKIASKQSSLVNLENGSPPLGPESAPITIVEFGDYQCTYCKKFFHETVESILINYVETGKVKMLFKDFIVVGQDSIHAANAAHCANDQQMFWQYHSILYNNWAGEGTGWVSSEQLNKFANTLELDMDKFSNCISELKWKKLVNESHDDGVVLGVTATPTFFVIDQNKNVMKITGAQQYDVFKEVFDSSLEK